MKMVCSGSGSLQEIWTGAVRGRAQSVSANADRVCRKLSNASASDLYLPRRPPLVLSFNLGTMNSQDAFRKLAQQLQRASSGRGGGPSPRGFLTGGGLVVALIGGGIALNASLFNGTHASVHVCDILLKHCIVDGGHRAIKYTR